MEKTFTYTQSDKIIYCKRCGQIAGEPTECPGYTGHDFVSTKVPLVCERCGATIGRASKCPGYTGHDFIKVR